MQKEQEQNLITENTPPENQGKFKRLFEAFKVRAGYYFKETFRRHTNDEYGEFFSRGHVEKDRVNKVYPWVYVRALCVLFLLFAFVVLVLLVTGNTLAYPTVLLFGGIFVNVPLMICLYELYSKRDLKFSTLVIVMILGGVISVSLSEIGYTIYDADDIEWFSPFYTGILEEFSKAIVAIAAIVLLKKRNPYVCFLIAAAVGTGFSISEDMGYIFVYARSSSSYAGLNLQYGVAVCMARAVISLCTHTMWTGLIGWAYAKFRKPFINPKFWGIAIYSILLHSLWDFSLEAVAITFLRIGLAILVAIPVILIIIKSRKPDIPTPIRKDGEQLSLTPERESTKVSYKAILNFVLYFTAAALFFVAAVTVPFGSEYITYTFNSEEEFISYMQNGLTFESDWEREYDETAEDYAYVVEDGFKTQALQKVESGGYIYYYYYYFYNTQTEEETDEDMGELTEDTPEQTEGDTDSGTEDEPVEEEPNYPVQIRLEIDGEVYTCGRIRVYSGASASEDGTQYASYYWLNNEALSWSRSGTTFTVTTSNQKTYGYAGEITLLVFMSLCVFAAAITFVHYKYKAFNLKKLERARESCEPIDKEIKNKTAQKDGSDKRSKKNE